VAELLELSGIMALFFCGICNAHYSYYSTTHAAKISSKYAFEALAFMSEMFVFAYLGMQVVVARHSYDLGLIVSALPLCFLSRAANIYPSPGSPIAAGETPPPRPPHPPLPPRPLRPHLLFTRG